MVKFRIPVSIFCQSYEKYKTDRLNRGTLKCNEYRSKPITDKIAVAVNVNVSLDYLIYKPTNRKTNPKTIFILMNNVKFLWWQMSEVQRHDDKMRTYRSNPRRFFVCNSSTIENVWNGIKYLSKVFCRKTGFVRNKQQYK